MPDGLGRKQPGILVTTDAVGGVWRYALDLAAGCAARGIGTTLAVLGPAPSPAQRAEAAQIGAPLVETGLPLDWTAASKADLESASDALRLLAAGRSSVHLHAPALLGAERWPAPVVAVAHSCVATWWLAVRGGEWPEDFRWRTEATAAGLRAADAVIAPSAAHAASVRAVYGDVQVQVVHNGSGPRTSTPARGQRPRAVLTAGRLWDEGKNAAALDRAAAALGAPILAAGPTTGPHGGAVALPHLRLLGTLDPAGMDAAFAGASVFASMALYEPFGLAVLEAAGAGMRLVLADIPSLRELWDGAALFVPEEADLLPTLRRALDLPGDGGARARARRYTLGAMVEGTLAVHRAVGALV